MPAKTTEPKQEAIEWVLPKGRLINNALFVKEAYKDEDGHEGTPQYKAEVAFEKGGAIEEYIDKCCAMIREEYGDNTFVEFIEEADKGLRCVTSPFRDGDIIAADRENRDKPADAYKGCWIIRATTIYNRDFEDGDGGVFVIDADAETEITPLDKAKVYNGCYVRVKVTPKFYKMSGKLGQKLYLKGVQKVDDGEKLKGEVDQRKGFEPAKGRTTGDAAPARRTRKG